MTSKSELKRFVAQGKPGARAEELAKTICIDGRNPRWAIYSALIAYGEEVRAMAAQECKTEHLEGPCTTPDDVAYDLAIDHCAEAIEKMGLP